MSVVKVANLTKSYGNMRGIIDINLEIEKGEIYGLIGPNGAGKSTIIRTLLNLLHPNSGRATIFGLDSHKDYEKILMEVGYLPGELNYYDNMRAIDLLLFSEKFYKKNCNKKRIELAMKLDFDLHQKIDSLSLGNKKKLGIIDAMQHEPQLLILDEPTSGLDPLMQRKFFELIKTEQAKGVTVIFSSHVLSEVQKVCDKVAIIKLGKIIAKEDINNHNSMRVKSVAVKTDSVVSELIEGISAYTKVTDGYEFLYKGDIKELFLFLENYNITDINISEPNLEDVFIHFYE